MYGDWISIHAPRAGCDVGSGNIWLATNTISIHAPRAGCDGHARQRLTGYVDFNPRTPCGVRRGHTGQLCVLLTISIHAPRAGCDWICAPAASAQRNFNPRTPCGVRQRLALHHAPPNRFQSTHPVRGATSAMPPKHTDGNISIHAPRAGCDGKFDGFTRPNLRKRYKKVSVQPKKRAKKKIKEMLCSHSHIFGWISGAKVPEFPVR